MTTKLLIPLMDFERIHMTIYSILNNENGDLLKSCFFFSMFGAAILRRHYKINATVNAGIAGYQIGNGDKNILMFAEPAGNELRCTANGFHAWIEADGWLLDLMSPLFPKIIPGQPKMLQKKLSDMAAEPDKLNSIGDFFLYGSQERTNELFEHFTSKPAHADLLHIAENWYRRPPKKMFKTISISDGKGNINAIPLSGTRLVGVW